MITRAISAIVGLLIVYATWYFFAASGLVVFCSIFSLLATIEFSLMVEQHNKLIRTLFIILAFSFYLLFTFVSHSFFIFLIYFIALSSYFTLFSNYSNEVRGLKLNSWLVGIVYCGALAGTVTSGILLKGHSFFIALFILSFGTDTFAYFGGRLFGKHKLAPQISPNKTIEGSLTGLVFASICGYFFLSQLDHSGSHLILALCCILASLFSQAGDLFESMIKRNSGVKDSGKLMPGHGGILDRIDGLLFVAPPLYLWMLYFT